MTKRITLFGMMLLLSVVSVFASGFQLPKVDIARQQKMAAEVNTDLMMRPKGSVNSPFSKTRNEENCTRLYLILLLCLVL